MKLVIGDKVKYDYPANSFPRTENNGKSYTGVVTNVRAETTHDRANVDIDKNPEYLISIECNQQFIELAS